jgi:hypothetical protein
MSEYSDIDRLEKERAIFLGRPSEVFQGLIDKSIRFSFVGHDVFDRQGFFIIDKASFGRYFSEDNLSEYPFEIVCTKTFGISDNRLMNSYGTVDITFHELKAIQDILQRGNLTDIDIRKNMKTSNRKDDDGISIVFPNFTMRNTTRSEFDELQTILEGINGRLPQSMSGEFNLEFLGFNTEKDEFDVTAGERDKKWFRSSVLKKASNTNEINTTLSLPTLRTRQIFDIDIVKTLQHNVVQKSWEELRLISNAMVELFPEVDSPQIDFKNFTMHRTYSIINHLVESFPDEIIQTAIGLIPEAPFRHAANFLWNILERDAMPTVEYEKLFALNRATSEAYIQRAVIGVAKALNKLSNMQFENIVELQTLPIPESPIFYLNDRVLHFDSPRITLLGVAQDPDLRTQLTNTQLSILDLATKLSDTHTNKFELSNEQIAGAFQGNIGSGAIEKQITKILEIYRTGKRQYVYRDGNTVIKSDFHKFLLQQMPLPKLVYCYFTEEQAKLVRLITTPDEHGRYLTIQEASAMVGIESQAPITFIDNFLRTRRDEAQRQYNLVKYVVKNQEILEKLNPIDQLIARSLYSSFRLAAPLRDNTSPGLNYTFMADRLNANNRWRPERLLTPEDFSLFLNKTLPAIIGNEN